MVEPKTVSGEGPDSLSQHFHNAGGGFPQYWLSLKLFLGKALIHYLNIIYGLNGHTLLSKPCDGGWSKYYMTSIMIINSTVYKERIDCIRERYLILNKNNALTLIIEISDALYYV